MGKSASRSGEPSAVARCVERSGPDVRLVGNWHCHRSEKTMYALSKLPNLLKLPPEQAGWAAEQGGRG